MYNRNFYFRRLWLVLAIVLSLNFISTIPVHGFAVPGAVNSTSAADPVIHAVLFYSPTCGHCHIVMNEVLPPLKEKYGSQLDILEINATEEAGNVLFNTAVQEFNVPGERLGVPALFIGDTHLVGSREIPEQLPNLIETGILRGGVGWPAISGLGDYIQSLRPQEDPQEEETRPVFIERFLRDRAANSVAVVVLLGMIASIVAVGFQFLRTQETTGIRSLPAWVVPVLCILGLVIAGYLTYVEVTNTNALCGPLGDCNTVQQSPFAKVWGILPVGVLGLIGYLAILAAWLVHRFGSPVISIYATLAMWGMALLGALFAAYLTFLEPFVIGATCAWCLGNAIVITLLLLVTTPPAIKAAAQIGDDEED